MIFQKQLFRHRPEEGIYGDCCRTAYACLLDLKPEAVPHFGELHWEDPEGWSKATREFLAKHEMSRVFTVFQGTTPLADILAHVASVNPDIYYLLTGRSRTGVDHVVVCLNGEIIWDPSLDDAGIVGPAGDGNWWVEYLVSRRLVATKD